MLYRRVGIVPPRLSGEPTKIRISTALLVGILILAVAWLGGFFIGRPSHISASETETDEARIIAEKHLAPLLRNDQRAVLFLYTPRPDKTVSWAVSWDRSTPDEVRLVVSQILEKMATTSLDKSKWGNAALDEKPIPTVVRPPVTEDKAPPKPIAPAIDDKAPVKP